MTDQCEGCQGVEGGRRSDVNQSEETGSDGDEDDSPNRDHVVSADLNQGFSESMILCSQFESQG